MLLLEANNTSTFSVGKIIQSQNKAIKFQALQDMVRVIQLLPLDKLLRAITKSQLEAICQVAEYNFLVKDFLVETRLLHTAMAAQ